MRNWQLTFSRKAIGKRSSPYPQINLIFDDRDINAAVEEYFAKGYGEKASVSKANPKALEQLFNKYKDPKTNNIEGEGVAAFYEDLGVDAGSDLVSLLLSQYMGAQTMGVYTQQEFTNGLQKVGVSSIDELKKKLPSLNAELRDPTKFKELYKWSFDYAKDTGFKNLNVDTAVALWQVLLSERCKFLHIWIDFYQIEKKDMQVVQRDTWQMLYELIEATKGDFNNFVDDGCWPSIIDQFNDFFKKRQ